ncbi:uncharacterized protein LOC135717593 [Ochlerotatus camptorhynchus]|uniref:uncharacterized protein LOC135717593 n=1 Tax=Ochlerotatus camptorhynchus TaxID=644619 RepID=UPI0031DA3A55
MHNFNLKRHVVGQHPEVAVKNGLLNDNDEVGDSPPKKLQKILVEMDNNQYVTNFQEIQGKLVCIRADLASRKGRLVLGINQA